MKYGWLPALALVTGCSLLAEPSATHTGQRSLDTVPALATPIPLSDAAQVWCSRNAQAVAAAGLDLDVYEATFEDGSFLEDPDVVEGMFAFARGELSHLQNVGYEAWRSLSPVAYSRACSAAFDLRDD